MATAGFIAAEPNVVNIVASDVTFSVDRRSRSTESIERVMALAAANLEKVCAACGAEFAISVALDINPVAFSPELRQALAQSCDACGYSRMEMVSGAGHDLMRIAPVLRSAMLFIPSKAGRSHCKEEWSDCKDLAKAADILEKTIFTLDEEESL